jgi:hypothetical protein
MIHCRMAAGLKRKSFCPGNFANTFNFTRQKIEEEGRSYCRKYNPGDQPRFFQYYI